MRSSVLNSVHRARIGRGPGGPGRGRRTTGVVATPLEGGPGRGLRTTGAVATPLEGLPVLPDSGADP
jgi:hypothetical protein